MYVSMGVCECASVRVCECASACECVRVRASACECACAGIQTHGRHQGLTDRREVVLLYK